MLQFAKSKLQAIEMMKKISEHVTDHCILERNVLYLVSPYDTDTIVCKSLGIRFTGSCLSCLCREPCHTSRDSSEVQCINGWCMLTSVL